MENQPSTCEWGSLLIAPISQRSLEKYVHLQDMQALPRGVKRDQGAGNGAGGSVRDPLPLSELSRTHPALELDAGEIRSTHLHKGDFPEA